MAVPANPVNWERTMTHAARDRRRDRVVPGLGGGNAPATGWTCLIAVV
jgi:hypothetical protein